MRISSKKKNYRHAYLLFDLISLVGGKTIEKKGCRDTCFVV